MKELTIIGPPGTGKTTTLAKRALQAAQRYGSDNVMACSLTKAAAAQVAGKGSDTTIPAENVGTLHSFAFHALGKPELADSPKALKRWNEWINDRGFPHYRLSGAPSDVDETAAENRWSGETQGDRCYQAMGIARSRMLGLETQSDFTREFWGLWNARNREEDLTDFTGLLERSLEETDHAPGEPAVIFTDEAQDTSALGMVLLRHWARSAEHLVTVGDPLQNLYAWAGSDANAFIGSEATEDRRWVLSQSFRVPRAVHVVALRWIEPLKREMEARFGKPLEYRPRDADGEARRLSAATFRYPEPAVRDAERYFAEGKSVMFLAACSHMLEPLIAVLRREGIPFGNRWRVKRGDWNPLAPRKGVSAADRVLSYLRPCEEAWPGESRGWSREEVWRWAEVLEARGAIKHGQKERIKEAAQAPLGAGEEAGIGELLEWFEETEILGAMDEAAEGRTEWLERHFLGTKRRVMEFPCRVVRRSGTDALRARPRVTVGTVHSVKGGEADVVYLFPDLSQAGMTEWMRGGEGQAGIRRLFYVGQTRARESLVVCSQATPMAVQISV